MLSVLDSNVTESSPHPCWTAPIVAERLVEAFRLLPHHPVYSSGGRLRLTGDGVTASARDALSWPMRYVPEPRQRLALMVWARCKAEGSSIRERFAALGVERNYAERSRRRALERIADGLNASDDLLQVDPTGET